MKTLHGTCDAERYILPNTACGQSASQYTTFTANGDTLKTAIFYTRSSANCNNLFIGGAEEGIFGGSNPVTWYGFTYYNQFTYATCFYLNGAYGQYLPIYPNITVPVGHTPIFTNYNGVGCTGSAYGHSTPALN